MIGISVAQVLRMIQLAGQSCTLERRPDLGTIDDYRQPILGDFAPFAPYGDGDTLVDCFLYPRIAPGLERQPLQDRIFDYYDLYLTGAPDVREGDRVNGVVATRTLATINSRTLGVDSVEVLDNLVTIAHLIEVR